MTDSFALSESHTFDGQLTWRLKESEIRFRGSGSFASLVLQRIPVSVEQKNAFRDALDMLAIWAWRDNYSPFDVNMAVLDGSSWSFAGSFGDRHCKCGGDNAYPSFADPQQTTHDRGRFGCLVTAMYDCFHIESYIRAAENLRLRAAGQPANDGNTR